jgi:pimeloyl-ACP methyl ester carboxylesterase
MAEITRERMKANGLDFDVDQAGAGEDVALLLHGFPESRFSWRHQLGPLADLGWRAIAPDLRGYGGSSRPPRTSDYAIEHLVDDVAGLFEAAGARRRLLIGHDWGAAIAWAFALDRRLPLDGLVIMNVPHPAVLARVMAASWRQPLKSWYMGFFQLPRLPEALLTANGARAIGRAFNGMAVDKSRFPPEITDVYRKNALIPGAMTAMINYYRANTGMLSRWGQIPPVIEVPTLMIWGEADTALGIENTEGYGPLVRDFTLNRLPGVSHWVQQEAPERVNALLEAWLLARLARPSGEPAAKN